MTDVSAVNPFATTPPTTTSSIGDELGADVFLQLLVAQLKYQNPTSPADGTEFLAQTAQFTMVEKLTQIAEHAEVSSIVNANLGAATLVGREITWLRDDGTFGSGRVESARLGSAGPVLVVDGGDVPFELVASVAEYTAPPAPDPAPESTTPDSTTPDTDGTDAAAVA